MTAEKIARAIHEGLVNPMLTCLILIAMTGIGLVSR